MRTHAPPSHRPPLTAVTAVLSPAGCCSVCSVRPACTTARRTQPAATVRASTPWPPACSPSSAPPTPSGCSSTSRSPSASATTPTRWSWSMSTSQSSMRSWRRLCPRRTRPSGRWRRRTSSTRCTSTSRSGSSRCSRRSCPPARSSGCGISSSPKDRMCSSAHRPRCSSASATTSSP